jgi:hypothetical protein
MLEEIGASSAGRMGIVVDLELTKSVGRSSNQIAPPEALELT